MGHVFTLSEDQTNFDSFHYGPHTPSHDGGMVGSGEMFQRIKELENDAHQMKTDIAVIRSNYATKADVSDAKSSIIIWVVGAVVLAQIIPAMPAIITAIKTAID